MADSSSVESIREKLVLKTVHNVRNLKEKENTSKGMYRDGIKLDLQRSRLLTESYKETEGQPMILRRAKGMERILTGMGLYIQDWELIVGNNVPTPQGLFFGIDMNWRSVRRVAHSEEGRHLLSDEERVELDDMIEYWKGRSMSDIQQSKFSGEVLKYWHMGEGSPGFWSHWSELGIPNYEKIFKIGFRGLIQQAEDRLQEIDREAPFDYIDQKEFLEGVIISLKAVISLAHRYGEMARRLAEESADPENRERLHKIART
ncbi:MAG: hypothetical protein HOB38_27095, partial [Deltaproteobacteria bacterium]|nr:hypothetical protein [Deltaproteobacteria bacterium]